MPSKTLQREAHRGPSAQLISLPEGLAAQDEVGAQDEALQTICEESEQCESLNTKSQAEVAALHAMCEESKRVEGHKTPAGVEDTVLQAICEDSELDGGFERENNDLRCAICEESVEGQDCGCAHTGHWHAAFEDCGARCVQLGFNIGKQHWGCCYQVDRNSLRCPRAKHVPMDGVFDAGIDSQEFYSEYHGHRPEHLYKLVRSFRKQGVEELVWFAGDSTLDNKYWLFTGDHPDLLPGATNYTANAINAYENVLVPPRMVMDVSYHLNWALQGKLSTGLHGSRQIVAVNASYEEGTLSDRAGDMLLPQDAFIRNHIGPQDTLVVSVGGNDVALKPSLKTALSALSMSRMASLEAIEAGRAVGQGHFYSLFHTKTKQYVEKLIARTKPKRVIICTLYFLDEARTGSWADNVLGHLGYDNDPSRLQAAIRHAFATATSTIQIDGVEVVPVPLFHALDGKTSSDYVSRVEPSVTGGAKMALLLADAIVK